MPSDSRTDPPEVPQVKDGVVSDPSRASATSGDLVDTDSDAERPDLVGSSEDSSKSPRDDKWQPAPSIEPTLLTEAHPSTRPPVPKRKSRTSTEQSSDAVQSSQKRRVVLGHGKKPSREWFARIRIREDRLARLWVSNLTGHDVVVWSNKEKRWVAFLGVQELRRAVDAAEQEFHRTGSGGKPPTGHPAVLSRPPGTLPPAPPLALLHSAAAGVGELRLRSIAQNQGSTSGSRTTSETSRATLPPQLLYSAESALMPSRRRRAHQLGGSSSTASRSKRAGRWQWGAMERVLWVACGVLAMFMVSGAGSADEKPSRPESPSVFLTADRYDPAGTYLVQSDIGPSIAQSLLGPRLECPVRPSYCKPPPSLTDSDGDASTEPEHQEPERDVAAPTRQRSSTEAQPRTHQPNVARNAQDRANLQPGVPADLNFPAVRAALFNAAAVAKTCRGESVGGKAVVTFEPQGTVRSVELPLLIGDRPDRDCIIRSFRSVRVPPFTGRAVAVKKDF